MTSVRAKFRVDAINRAWAGACEVRSVVMSPVTGGSEENKSFWKYTPSGKLELGCVNLDAADRFELGKEYYVDFTAAG